ncbi:MAG: dihydroneopterin aldolase [Spirochaetaceae bacterium]
MEERIRVGLTDLQVACIIGARASEREQEQTVYISFEIEYVPGDDDIGAAVDYSEVADRLKRLAENGRYVLLETLAREAARELARDDRVSRLEVQCRKPGARADAAFSYARAEWRRT